MILGLITLIQSLSRVQRMAMPLRVAHSPLAMSRLENHPSQLGSFGQTNLAQFSCNIAGPLRVQYYEIDRYLLRDLHSSKGKYSTMLSCARLWPFRRLTNAHHVYGAVTVQFLHGIITRTCNINNRPSCNTPPPQLVHSHHSDLLYNIHICQLCVMSY